MKKNSAQAICDMHNELPEKNTKLIISSKKIEKKFAVIDCYNRYLTGYIGWAGIWGHFKDKILFDTQVEAESQMAFMFIDSCLCMKPVICEIESKEKITSVSKILLKTDA